MKSKLVRIAENCLFALNVFIIFLLLAGDRIIVPSWLQPVGRMHPMLLHFPIVILMLAMVLEFFNFRDKYRTERFYPQFADSLLLIGALSSGVTAIMGLLLSKEAGYEGKVLQWHKFSGVSIVFLASLVYWSRNSNWYRKYAGKLAATFSLAFVVLAAHFGSVLTHGENFILAPVSNAETNIPVDQAMVFDHLIKPVFEQKCISCHNEEKQKGDLVLLDSAFIAKGGRSGKLFDIVDASVSLLLKRIHLPLEHRKHMPPAGKVQLTEEEIVLLDQWIKAGMPFSKRIVELPATDSLRMIATARLFPNVDPDELFDFAAADEQQVARLNNNYRVVAPIAKESPALAVSLYNRSVYKSELLNELMPVKDQIVSLNLNKLPVKDEDLKIVSHFKNLRRLSLNFTNITAPGLNELTKLQHLKTISLAGTRLNAAALNKIIRLEGLTKLVIWNTGIDSAGIRQLKKINPAVALETGYADDTTRIQLNPPRIVNKLNPGSLVFVGNSFEMHLTHPIPGVEIRYSTDGKKPDSLKSPLFVKDTVFTENAMIEARAFKPGWLGSDSIKIKFYRSTIKPDSAYLLSVPHERYVGAGSSTFTNWLTGDFDLNTDKWIAYKEKDMEVLFEFKQPVTLSSVGLHFLLNTGPWIFPPEKVELWGGSGKDQLQLLSVVTPVQPDKKDRPRIDVVQLNLKPVSISYLKIRARPLPKLPAWHKEKGKPGWLFVDEVLMN